MRLKNLLRPHRLIPFLLQFRAYRQAARQAGTRLPTIRNLRAMLDDATADTGFDTHYVYHTSWAAGILARTGPERHVDISSAIWFVGIASAICPIDHYDYRPPLLDLPNVRVKAGDLVNLPFEDGSLASISCMHVVEHVGLGRYGDPLDPSGDLKAMKELARVVAPGGLLLFVVPAGRPRVLFNSHRIYAYEAIVSAFNDFDVEEFSLITDGRNGSKLIFNAEPSLVAEQKYGCGCWAFRRKPV